MALETTLCKDCNKYIVSKTKGYAIQEAQYPLYYNSCSRCATWIAPQFQERQRKWMDLQNDCRSFPSANCLAQGDIRHRYLRSLNLYQQYSQAQKELRARTMAHVGGFDKHQKRRKR